MTISEETNLQFLIISTVIHFLPVDLVCSDQNGDHIKGNKLQNTLMPYYEFKPETWTDEDINLHGYLIVCFVGQQIG